MARIRTIKPEFWSSPSTARASAVARLAFIAMWNWADDHGRGTANLKELEGFIFPNDDIQELSSGNTVHFRDVVAEVSECFNVTFYTVSGRPFYQIPTWDQHQRNERRAAQSKYPGPDEADSSSHALTRANAGNGGTPVANERNHRDSVAEIPNISGTGTGEQGNRGTGEQGTKPSSPAAPSPVGFDQFWDLYPRKKGKGEAKAAYSKAIKKTSPENILEGVEAHLPEWALKEPDKIPHPTTWLNQGRWDDVIETHIPQAPQVRQPQTTTDRMLSTLEMGRRLQNGKAS